MLSAHERKTLREIERQFLDDDPFRRAFDDIGQQPSYSLRWACAMPRYVYTTAIVVAVALGLLMMVVRAPGTALVFATLVTMIAVVRKRRDELGRRDT